MRLRWRRAARAVPLIVVTDPGPDPDDVKAILVAGILHHERRIDLLAVVANGGGQPVMRARLARTILDKINLSHIPVGIGSIGQSCEAQPHEYSLPGFDASETSRLHRGSTLLISSLERAQPKSVYVLVLSALRDLASVMHSHPHLVVSKVREVGIQGGLVRAEAGSEDFPYGWKPDTSQNNMFDMEAAGYVYNFCFRHHVPMVVVSRNVVPLLPMQLAKSFAQRTRCPILSYLADAQFLGLQGLWTKVCRGQLPARCDRLWFFQTFCGIDEEAFEKKGLSKLQADDSVLEYLNG